MLPVPLISQAHTLADTLRETYANVEIAQVGGGFMVRYRGPREDSMLRKKGKPRIRAKKTEVDGILFDSKTESEYYEVLKRQKAAGLILDFTLQPKFELVPAVKKLGRTNRKMEYIGDFEVIHPDGRIEILDVKGKETEKFLLKRKIFDWRYPELPLVIVKKDAKTGKWLTEDEIKKSKPKRKKG